MQLNSTQLESIVRAAKATGETNVTTQMADGTVIEIRFAPPKIHPLAALFQRLRKTQNPTKN